MPVLSHEETLTNWFASLTAETPVVLRGTWDELRADVLKWLAPREIVVLEHEGKIISIEKIRKLIASLTTTAPFGNRLVVIPDCDRLSAPAASALLKTLEEPRTMNRWLLVTRFPRRLLPTIRSRVQVLKSIPRSSEGKSPPAGGEGVEAFDFVERLSAKERRGLTDEELEFVAITIQRYLQRGPRTEVPPFGWNQGVAFRALLRLRDYYKIRSAGGNEKLAADVLLAAMMELEKTP